ncbi:hypothetical protein AB6A40_006877 [Gnathostoma spinigerum]|uniref:Major facilitator superfamily (MFS) profile domain-containing protein n=1 Tax=Gnathostoma spinigerum TaxID=75299 RepID=A0ABD6EJM2_9BILA
MGIFVTMPLSGLMCVYGFAGGWPSIFYLLGTAGIIFTVIWYFTAFDSPHVHPRISREEFVYIRSSMEENVEKRTRKEVAIPWIPMITSIPVWAIFIGHFCGDFGAYMMMTNLPLFMNDVLGFDQARMGLFAGIPYLLYAVVINLGGIAADKLRKSETLSTTGVRRLAMILGLGSQAVFLVACAYCQCGQENLVVTFLTLGIGLSGVQFAGYCVNYIDVAPHFAGTLVGIGNMLGGVAGIICPLLVGWLVKEGTREEWKIVFWITGVVLILGAMIFSIFCDGKVQSWARIEKAENKETSENLV